MTVRVEVPALGESIMEAVVLEWLKKEGDNVVQDEALLSLETEKVTLEIYAPSSGVLQKIEAQSGETVKVGDVLARIDSGGVLKGSGKAGKAPLAPSAPPPREERKSVLATEPPTEKAQETQGAQGGAEQAVAREQGSNGRAPMPAAAQMMAEQGLESQSVAGTGRGGQITKADVLVAREQTPAIKQQAPQQERREPLSVLRRRIAQRLKQAQNVGALLTTFNEIDMSRVVGVRKKYKDAFVQRHGIKLGLSSFFIKAVVEALARLPIIHARIEGDIQGSPQVMYPSEPAIGVAVASPKGLLVPVLRGAGRLSFAEIERALAEYVQAAQAGTLDISALSGGTFTITNGGIFGSMMSTPIVNPPQSSILGLHAIKERAVVVDGAVVVRPMMYVALTYDHRLIDGAEAVTFLAMVKEFIEYPERILVDV
ncbi:MAG: 2-oxoglutarate dehydrogenase complex dihydrolipoyllysine-residue succinyltransferase [Alphaproteobacteria bacterium GM202ARS2]|nr:2-oxoglutarate dehydrogenase complex dihydrolipoyllysine-residue succinyltransferase [Alphaproteobacteria bacterium GM202ARS2]